MCTRLILAGQPIPVIQRIMGDNTIDVIMKIYTMSQKIVMAACEGYYDNSIKGIKKMRFEKVVISYLSYKIKDSTFNHRVLYFD